MSSPRQAILAQTVKPRNPFLARKVPLPARIYRFPLDRWRSRGKQILFGAPFFAFYSLFQRLPMRFFGDFEYDLDSRKVILPFDSKNTQFQVLYCRQFENGYEPEVSALLDLLIKQKDVFYDIGSNWGYFSLFVASKPDYSGQIHAFEPFPKTFNDLKMIVDQTLLKNIFCHNTAIAEVSGQAEMKVSDHVHSGLAAIQKNAQGGGTEVKVSSLDALDLPAPHFIKIDVEGFETEVLKGAKKVLNESRPFLLFENWRDFDHPSNTLEPLKFLKDLGYRCYHPCWVKENEKVSIFVPEPYGSTRLALVPFESRERFLRQDQINVFACPESKLSHLETIFATNS